jgi:hypothetical protein
MIPPTLAGLASWSVDDLCRRLGNPGVAGAGDPRVDHSAHESTPDQLAIESYLDGKDLAGTRLLHVGVGNSALAARFHERCRAIDGVTLAEPELRHALSLGLARYRVWLCNKYSVELGRVIHPGYDFIIDNNPASFACCLFHFARMMDHYRWALRPGGQILTDQRGLDWVAASPSWRMTFEDWSRLADRFELRAVRLTETVYAMERARSQATGAPGEIR